MIIDPESFVPVELDRRLAAARVATASRRSPVRRRVRRGLWLRLAAWVTGRAIHA